MFLTKAFANRVRNRIAEINETVRGQMQSFHGDEAGLSTVEMILLLFIGVVIIVAILSLFWDEIWPKVQEIIDELFDVASSGGN
jgi:hypothetical protein